jgi:hypothetical protein
MLELWNVGILMTSYEVVTPVPGFRRDRVTGVQNGLYFLDSGFRRNDTKYHFLNFDKGVNAGSREKRALRNLTIPSFQYSIILR